MPGSSPYGRKIYFGVSAPDELEYQENMRYRLEHAIGPDLNSLIKKYEDLIKAGKILDPFSYNEYKMAKEEMEKRNAKNSKVYAISKTDSTRLSKEQQEANVKYIAEYLTKKGWLKEAIATLLGNIQQESHMNPGVWQREENKGGYGLVQWDPASKFLSWAFPGIRDQKKEANYLANTDPKKLMDSQLDYLIYSMDPKTPAEKRIWFPGDLAKQHGADDLMSSNDYMNGNISPDVDRSKVDKLTEVFVTHYERPKAFNTKDDEYKRGTRADELAERRQDANKWYELLW